jgi:copper chaperone
MRSRLRLERSELRRDVGSVCVSTPQGYDMVSGGYTPLEYQEEPMTTQTSIRAYGVEGMTCDHCVAAVRDEVGRVAGVESVEVELATGRLEVRGRDVSDDEIASAVEEAGYRLADDARASEEH